LGLIGIQHNLGIWFNRMKKATCRTSHFGGMGHHSHHIPSSTTQMVPPVINLTSPSTKCFLKNSKQLHTQGSPINTQGNLGQFLCHSTWFLQLNYETIFGSL
jgi:hypothetical protein